MNLKLITTLSVLSVCAIAESPVQAATLDVTPKPESTVELNATAAIAQQEDAAIRSMAQPETLVAAPETLTAEVAAPIALVKAPLIAQSDRSPSVRSTTPRIEVGTKGIPPVTTLPDRISLPSKALLPTNFENPITLGQAMDRSITTVSPLTDKMSDPVWSRRMEDLAAYQTAYSDGLTAWSGRVAQCMNEKPKLYVLRSDGAQLPMYFDGKEGTIVQNKDGISVCGM